MLKLSTNLYHSIQKVLNYLKIQIQMIVEVLHYALWNLKDAQDLIMEEQKWIKQRLVYRWFKIQMLDILKLYVLLAKTQLVVKLSMIIGQFIKWETAVLLLLMLRNLLHYKIKQSIM